MSNRSQDYISLIRTANRQIWDAVNTLVSAQREWNALDYGTTLGDGEGDNEGVTKIMVGAVAFDTANAFVATLNAGHAINMAKLL